MQEAADPYIDQETGVLRNLIGATTHDDLHKAEGDIVALAEVALESVPHTIDLVELQNIHKSLFGRIYDWAGDLRVVNIRKGSEEYFLDYGYLENGANFVFEELSKENCLRGLDLEDFVKRLSYFYEQLNFIHPFREGNGRTQRVFWQRIADEAGYGIDWSKVVGEELDNASLIGRTEHNLEPLERMFRKIVFQKDI